MKKVVFALLGIVALMVAGKFGLEHQYKKKLDQVIAQGQFFYDASYDKLFIDLEGGINVTNFKIRDKTGKIFDGSIDKFRLFTSDRMLLIKGFDSIKDGQFPDVFEVTVNNLSFDTSLTQEINAARECRYIEEPLPLQNFTDENVSIDFKLNFLTEGKDVFKVKWDSITRGITSLSTEFTLDKTLLKSPLSAGAGKDLPIKSLKATNEFNPVYTEAALNYCAKKLNMTVDNYVDTVIGSDNYYKGLKFIPSDELKAAIQAHFSGKNAMSISAKPNATARNVNQLKLFRPEQIIKALNLVVKENGQTITSIINPNKSLDTVAKEEKINEQPASPTVQANSKAKAPEQAFYGRRTFSYKPIPKSDLKKFINTSIKVYRKKRLIKGELLEVSNTKIKIDNNSYGGSSIMNLPLNEIDKVEAKFFKQ